MKKTKSSLARTVTMASVSVRYGIGNDLSDDENWAGVIEHTDRTKAPKTKGKLTEAVSFSTISRGSSLDSFRTRLKSACYGSFQKIR